MSKVKKIMRLKDIKIRNDFLETKPNPKKVKMYKQYYYENGETAKMITVNRDGYLVDGYIQYLVLKEADVEETVVVEKTTRKRKKKELPLVSNYKVEPTVYVFGKHTEDGKEYVWRLPKKWVEKDLHKNIKVGDWLIVNTHFGKKTITVTRIEMLDKTPVKSRVLKVVGKKAKYKKAYVSEIKTYDSDEENSFLLKIYQCRKELKAKLPEREYDLILSSIYEDMRKYMKLPNKVMGVSVDESNGKGFIVFFDKEADGKTYNVYKDDKGIFIKVYEEE